MGERDFDFWLGAWDVSWGDGLRGTNHIRRILGGRVLLEEFDGRPGTELRGKSVSVYDASANVWRQTWVDNEGNYLAFSGRLADGRMTLVGMRGDDLVRMRWYDIEADALTWAWERSRDSGRSWETLWELSYARRAGAGSAGAQPEFRPA